MAASVTDPRRDRQSWKSLRVGQELSDLLKPTAYEAMFGPRLSDLLKLISGQRCLALPATGNNATLTILAAVIVKLRIGTKYILEKIWRRASNHFRPAKCVSLPGY